MGRATLSYDCQGIQPGLEKLRMLFLTDYTEGKMLLPKGTGLQNYYVNKNKQINNVMLILHPKSYIKAVYCCIKLQNTCSLQK